MPDGILIAVKSVAGIFKQKYVVHINEVST